MFCIIFKDWKNKYSKVCLPSDLFLLDSDAQILWQILFNTTHFAHIVCQNIKIVQDKSQTFHIIVKIILYNIRSYCYNLKNLLFWWQIFKCLQLFCRHISYWLLILKKHKINVESKSKMWEIIVELSPQTYDHYIHYVNNWLSYVCFYVSNLFNVTVLSACLKIL